MAKVYTYLLTGVFSIVYFFSNTALYAQSEQMNPKEYNFTSFEASEADITSELKELTPDALEKHPEFGILPHNAPCDSCYELLQYRSDSSRMFVQKGSEGTHFYSQKAYGPLHYKNSKGELIAYNPKLKPTANGIFTSRKQETPTELDVLNKHSAFQLQDGSKFLFNRELELYYVDSSMNYTNLGVSNWSNRKVGEDGIKIIDAWPGIDIKITYHLDRIKSSFIIKKPLGHSSGFLVFQDNWNVPAHLTIQQKQGNTNSQNLWEGSYSLKDQNTEIFEIGNALGYDNSGIKSHTQQFGYKANANELEIWVPLGWMNDPAKVYPLVIDPLVTSSNTYSSGTMEFEYDGDWCGNSGACTYNLTVARPANSTLTDVLFDAEYYSDPGFCFGCWMSEAAFQISGPCGTSPGASTYWNCNTNNSGTCTGSGLSMFNTVSCLSPVCSGNITFTMSNSYCYCSTGGTSCGGSDPCQTMANNSWVITIEGNTLETLGNTSTGNGSTTINTGSCSGTTTLDPLEANGVPGYTYSWSTGATSSTITVNNWPSGQTYTCDVTDACGVTRTATFTVNCPLPVEMLDFDASMEDDEVIVNWITASEVNNSHFDVQRSTQGADFKSIATVKGQGTSGEENAYTYRDKTPYEGMNYYRLKQVDHDGTEKYSSIAKVFVRGEDPPLMISPNPTEGKLKLQYSSSVGQKTKIEIVDLSGKVVFSQTQNSSSGHNKVELDLGNFQKGIYFLKVNNNDGVMYQKIVHQ